MSRRPKAGDLARRFPITLSIAVLTLAIFFVQIALGGATDPVVQLRLGALRADRVAEHGEYWRLLMPLFLHHGWVHLVLNGLALLQLGALVESLWGGRRLLTYYVVCGLGGSLASAALNGMPIAGSVGASGAIMGLAGIVLGTSWYGREPIRAWLLDLVGRRLLHGVLLTFGLGIGLWLVLPIVDNWAHLGGFATGLLIAAATPDPTQEDLRRSLSAAAASAAAIAGTLVWMAVSGHRDDQDVALDIARSWAARISQQPGTWSSSAALPEVLQWFQRAGHADEGLEVYERAVDDLRDPRQLRWLVGTLYTQQEQGDDDVDRDVALADAAERWLQLAPDEPDALNALAWHLATRPHEDLRDPARAEALSRRSLERVGPADSTGKRRQRAVYLDTLGEVLFQLGDYEAALTAQQESVDLARSVEGKGWWFLEPDLPLDVFEERLEKIEDAS